MLMFIWECKSIQWINQKIEFTQWEPYRKAWIEDDYVQVHSQQEQDLDVLWIENCHFILSPSTTELELFTKPLLWIKYPFQRVLFQNNTIEGGTRSGLIFEDCQQVDILGNTWIRGMNSYGVYSSPFLTLHRISSARIENNHGLFVESDILFDFYSVGSFSIVSNQMEIHSREFCFLSLDCRESGTGTGTRSVVIEGNVFDRNQNLSSNNNDLIFSTKIDLSSCLPWMYNSEGYLPPPFQRIKNSNVYGDWSTLFHPEQYRNFSHVVFYEKGSSLTSCSWDKNSSKSTLSSPGQRYPSICPVEYPNECQYNANWKPDVEFYEDPSFQSNQWEWIVLHCPLQVLKVTDQSPSSLIYSWNVFSTKKSKIREIHNAVFMFHDHRGLEWKWDLDTDIQFRFIHCRFQWTGGDLFQFQFQSISNQSVSLVFDSCVFSCLNHRDGCFLYKDDYSVDDIPSNFQLEIKNSRFEHVQVISSRSNQLENNTLIESSLVFMNVNTQQESGVLNHHRIINNQFLFSERSLHRGIHSRSVIYIETGVRVVLIQGNLFEEINPQEVLYPVINIYSVIRILVHSDIHKPCEMIQDNFFSLKSIRYAIGIRITTTDHILPNRMECAMKTVSSFSNINGDGEIMNAFVFVDETPHDLYLPLKLQEYLDSQWVIPPLLEWNTNILTANVTLLGSISDSIYAAIIIIAIVSLLLICSCCYCCCCYCLRKDEREFERWRDRMLEKR